MFKRSKVTRTITSAAVSLSTAALTATLIAAPAQAADTGLFGSQDPTYDGVFRQSLAIAGLAAVDADIPKKAVDWLIDQQCADGSFESYRPDTSTPCGKSDPETFSGPTTDATGLAAAALYLAGRQSEARRAAAWLARTQNDDFGFASYVGGASNANSTAMALVGLQTVQPQDRSARIPNAKGFLGTLKLKCSSGGGLSYLTGGPANGLASSQAFMGLAGALPVTPASTLTADPRCVRGNTVSNVGGFLADAIRDNGAIPSDFGSGNDYSSTGWSLLGFVDQGTGRQAVTRALRSLESGAGSYAISDGQGVPAALGLLLLVSEATGGSPNDFGGVNLTRSLLQSIR